MQEIDAKSNTERYRDGRKIVTNVQIVKIDTETERQRCNKRARHTKDRDKMERHK